jgi:hypothetical protein
MIHHDEIFEIDWTFASSNVNGGRLLNRSDSCSSCTCSIKDILSFKAISEDNEYSFSSDEESESDDSDDESFSGAELVIMDRLKKSDSKNHIMGSGQRIVRPSCTANTKRAYDDPLLNSFLNESNGTSLIDNILNETDSKDDIKGRGRRVVKTRTKSSHGRDELLYKSKTSKEDDDIEKILKRSDSKKHIVGSGHRIVRTLPKKNPEGERIARCA